MGVLGTGWGIIEIALYGLCARNGMDRYDIGSTDG